MAPAGLHADDHRTGGASRTGDPGGENGCRMRSGRGTTPSVGLLSAQPTDSMRAANEAIVDGNVHVDDDQLHSALHFDGENFFAGQGRLLGIKEIVIASIQQNDTQGARDELGQALHSIQDFYAHSNWT